MRIHSQLGIMRAALLGSMGVTLAGACSSESDSGGTAGNPLSDGSISTSLRHRASSAICENNLGPKTDAAPPESDGGPVYGECEGDPECPGQFGYCARVPQGFTGEMGACRTGCTQDSDCESDFVCNCESAIGHCVSATCKLDSDCASGQLCLEHRTPNPCAGDDSVSYACAVPGTQCETRSECAQSEVCVAGQCEGASVCGRPFLVQGRERRAGAIERSDWAVPVVPETRNLSASERERLSKHWTEIACMEHASVAAFARFTLELLALGAPASLVEASQAALGDEILHTRLAFGLAQAYAKRPTGPDVLSLDGALAASMDFVEIVRHAFLEMCVGETCAAVEARAAALEATDPAVGEVLERIATEELRHAKLGHEFVKWALEEASPELRRGLVTELEAELLRRLNAADSGLHRTGIPSHGLLSDEELADVRRAALLEVVLPCSRALFSENVGTKPSFGAVA